MSPTLEPTDPTPDPGSRGMRSGSAPEGEATYEVWTVADEQGARKDAAQVLGGVGGEERERALVGAGRLYGRDHARARAALADGTHPLCRLKRADRFPVPSEREHHSYPLPQSFTS